MKKFKLATLLVVIITIIIGGIYLTSKLGNVSSAPVSQPAQREERLARLNNLARQRNREILSQQPDPVVSDLVAIGVFLNFLAVADNPSDLEKTNSYLINALGMKEKSDRDVLVDTARKYKDINLRIANETLAKRNDLQPQDPNLEKGLALRKLVKELRANLSKQGWSTFQSTILGRVKPQIKVLRQDGGKLSK